MRFQHLPSRTKDLTCFFAFTAPLVYENGILCVPNGAYFRLLWGSDSGEPPVSHTVHILNGPNLNLLGSREPEVYGATTLDDIKSLCEKTGETVGLAVEFRQSNDEGALVSWIQEAGSSSSGLIINAAGYTHTSVAIMDALLAVSVPVIEVHLSNIYKREEFRHHSYISRAAQGVICGFGAHGYKLALTAMSELLQSE